MQDGTTTRSARGQVVESDHKVILLPGKYIGYSCVLHALSTGEPMTPSSHNKHTLGRNLYILCNRTYTQGLVDRDTVYARPAMMNHLWCCLPSLNLEDERVFMKGRVPPALSATGQARHIQQSPPPAGLKLHTR